MPLSNEDFNMICFRLDKIIDLLTPKDKQPENPNDRGLKLINEFEEATRKILQYEEPKMGVSANPKAVLELEYEELREIKEIAINGAYNEISAAFDSYFTCFGWASKAEVEKIIKKARDGE